MSSTIIARKASPEDEGNIAPLISLFRVELKKLNGLVEKQDIEQARQEFRGYFAADYPMFVALDNDGKTVGYIVCKVIDKVVWVESIFVSENERRKGTATQLYHEAEKLVLDLGNSTLYNWIHPNNDKMIAFLSKLEYNVLNLIEVRKKRNDEEVSDKIWVGNHEYHY